MKLKIAAMFIVLVSIVCAQWTCGMLPILMYPASADSYPVYTLTFGVAAGCHDGFDDFDVPSPPPPPVPGYMAAFEIDGSSIVSLWTDMRSLDADTVTWRLVVQNLPIDRPDSLVFAWDPETLPTYGEFEIILIDYIFARNHTLNNDTIDMRSQHEITLDAVDIGDYLSIRHIAATRVESHENKPVASVVSFSPNPFNSSVQITVPACMQAAVCDILGNKVQDLAISAKLGSANVFEWHPSRDVPAGIYLVKAWDDETAMTGKLIYLK